MKKFIELECVRNLTGEEKDERFLELLERNRYRRSVG